MSFPIAFHGHILPRDYRQFSDGSVSAPVSPAGNGVIRYNDTTKTFQVSIDGGVYIDLVGAGGGSSVLGGNAGSTPVGSGVTVYLGLGIGVDSVEGHAEFVAGRAGVLSDLYVDPLANSLDANTVFTVRINGVSTAIAVTVPGGSTAQFSDTANSAVVAAGDRVSLEANTTASTGGTMTGCAFGLKLG